MDLAEIDDLEVILMNDIDGGPVIDNGNVSPDIEEVFTIVRELLLDLLQL